MNLHLSLGYAALLSYLIVQLNQIVRFGQIILH